MSENEKIVYSDDERLLTLEYLKEFKDRFKNKKYSDKIPEAARNYLEAIIQFLSNKDNLTEDYDKIKDLWLMINQSESSSTDRQKISSALKTLKVSIFRDHIYENYYENYVIEDSVLLFKITKRTSKGIGFYLTYLLRYFLLFFPGIYISPERISYEKLGNNVYGLVISIYFAVFFVCYNIFIRTGYSAVERGLNLNVEKAVKLGAIGIMTPKLLNNFIYMGFALFFAAICWQCSLRIFKVKSAYSFFVTTNLMHLLLIYIAYLCGYELSPYIFHGLELKAIQNILSYLVLASYITSVFKTLKCGIDNAILISSLQVALILLVQNINKLYHVM
ncbi:MAG: hypothetical protein AB7E96_10575 [Deferribacterales bacterium]